MSTGPKTGSNHPSRRSPARVFVTNPVRAGLVGWLARYCLYSLLVIGFAATAAGILLYRSFAATLPPLEHIERYQTTAPGVTRVYARGGVLLSELARENRAYASYDQIPDTLVQAFLAVEDRRFFTHGGLDFRGLGRAIVTNIRSGTIAQGGSTITQQVAKSFLNNDQTIARKIREAILSARIEARLSKPEILEIYLNKIFLGHGAHGVAAAASRYFGKELSELTLAECALIAGLARAPSRYNPASHPERALARRAVVLQDMVEAQAITPTQRDQAIDEPLHLVSKPDVFRDRAPYFAEDVRRTVEKLMGEEPVLTDGLQIETTLELPLQRSAAAAVDQASRALDMRQGWRGPEAHFADEDDRERLDARLLEAYGATPLADTPSRVRPWRLAYVTEVHRRFAVVDVGATQAGIALRGMLWATSYDRNTGENNLHLGDIRSALEVGDVVWVRRVSTQRAERPPAELSADELPEVELGFLPRTQAALYTVDLDTGYVVAMQGGTDYDRSQFNRPTQGCRQPGSVFKTIYYALALDGDYAMDTVLEDHPYEPEPGEEWNPQNIHGTLDGTVLLRNAFIHSLNLPSIRLFKQLGADNVVAWARRLGFTTPFAADRALSLGASCVQMDELTRAFAIFASDGKSFPTTEIRRIKDKTRQTRLDQRAFTDGAMDLASRLDAMGDLALHPPAQLIDRRTAFLITHMLHDVVTSGIGRRALKIGVPAGGKSGTASKNKFTTDTWFVGFTSRYATAAWVGDDQYERSMGDDEASYTTATPLWTEFMTAAVDGIPHDEIPTVKPPGVVSRNVVYEAGGRERSATLWFRGERRSTKEDPPIASP